MQSFHQTVEFLQRNSGVFILAVCILLLVVMLQYLRQTKKIRQKMELMDENIVAQFERLMDENEQKEVEIASEKRREREAYKEAIEQREKKEQEAVFDAVLQEIFP